MGTFVVSNSQLAAAVVVVVLLLPPVICCCCEDEEDDDDDEKNVFENQSTIPELTCFRVSCGILTASMMVSVDFAIFPSSSALLRFCADVHFFVTRIAQFELRIKRSVTDVVKSSTLIVAQGIYVDKLWMGPLVVIVVAVEQTLARVND